MATYVYPLNPTVPVSIAAGADFATETTLLLIKGYVDGLETLVGTTNTTLGRLTGSFVNATFDYVSANYSGSTTDVWTYKTGGSGGTTVKTVTVTYTDATKTVISTVGAS